jgi:hypothetical protein
MQDPLAGAGTGLSLTSPAGGEMPMQVPIGGSYPRSLATNYREPIGSNLSVYKREVTK